MKTHIYIFILSSFLATTYILSDATISFSFKSQLNPDRISKKMRQPGKIGRYTINGLASYPHYAGIFASYAGFLQTSDSNGQVLFPRQQDSLLFHLVITNKLTPILMFENTVSHWEVVPGAPAAIYKIECKYDNKKNQHYWDIQLSDLPEYPTIPLDTIVIFAKPHNIGIKMEPTPTHLSSTMVLPDLYILKEINVVARALYVLNIKHLFRPVSFSYKTNAGSYEKMVTP